MISQAVQLLTLFVTILVLGRQIAALPDRVELGPRVAVMEFRPVKLTSDAFGALSLRGAWEVTSDDPGVGGISALAADGSHLVALTDSGAVLRFPRPARQRVRVEIRELPDGPGDPRFKSARDAEALVAHPSGRGWWVAFENYNQIWLYDMSWRGALKRLDVGRQNWKRNRGIEGMVARDGLLTFPEDGRSVVTFHDRRPPTVHAIENPRGKLADAVSLPGGAILGLHRDWTLGGFRSGLALIEPAGANYRFRGSWRLPLSSIDNVEALAAERTPGGAIRLWLMTDDNFHRPMRTLLVAVDLPQALG